MRPPSLNDCSSHVAISLPVCLFASRNHAFFFLPLLFLLFKRTTKSTLTQTEWETEWPSSEAGCCFWVLFSFFLFQIMFNSSTLNWQIDAWGSWLTNLWCKTTIFICHVLSVLILNTTPLLTPMFYRFPFSHSKQLFIYLSLCNT